MPITKTDEKKHRHHFVNVCARGGVKEYQFWQQHNKPIWLYSPEVTDQKIDYIHNNPVVSGFVLEPKDWKYSSAIDYCGGQGLLKLYHL